MREQRRTGIFEYRAVVFDLDGTLYDQPKLRRMMAASILGHCLGGLAALREIYILYCFRRYREHWDKLGPRQRDKQGGPKGHLPEQELEEEQYQYTAKRVHSTPQRVREIVRHWIYKQPLKDLKSCRDEGIAELIGQLRRRKIPVIIYSDYPVAEKIKALGIEADGSYSALDPEIMSLKPNKKGLMVILRDLGLKPEEILMIGDRDSRDGQAARNVGADYVILSKKTKNRERFYRSLVRSPKQNTHETL